MKKEEPALFFFNQASMYRCSALNGDSVVEAQRKGMDITTDYGEDIQEAFQRMTSYYPM